MKAAPANGAWEVGVSPMPKTEWDVWELIQNNLDDDYDQDNNFAVIEKVGGYIGTAQPGSSAFKFGRGVGVLIGLLIAARIPFEEVHPRTWQKALSIHPRAKKSSGSEESKGQFKNRLKSKCQQLFPTQRPTLKTCDALLICEYAKRKRTGTL